MATLIQTQAAFVQNQAAFLAQMAETNREIAELKRTNAEHFARIERILIEHSRILAEHTRILADHSRILEALPDAIRQKWASGPRTSREFGFPTCSTGLGQNPHLAGPGNEIRERQISLDYELPRADHCNNRAQVQTRGEGALPLRATCVTLDRLGERWEP
jgi:hypothetical protein